MTNPRRQRQKELHRSQVSASKQAQKRYANFRRLKMFILGIVILCIFGAITWMLSDRGANSASSSSTTTTPAPPTTAASNLVAPAAGASITDNTKCPPSDGSAKRTTAFAKAPPTCIKAGAKYEAIFDTSKGKFTADLDSTASPIGVNNFVVLARYKFYDGIPFHRVAPDFAIQAGDPVGEPWGTHGPGYTISEEPPADLSYDKYDLAMANTSNPDSTGSQFFVATGDTAALNAKPTYTYLGSVVSGRDVVDAINKVPTAGPNGDTPQENVVIKSIIIKELPA